MTSISTTAPMHTQLTPQSQFRRPIRRAARRFVKCKETPTRAAGNPANLNRTLLRLRWMRLCVGWVSGPAPARYVSSPTAREREPPIMGALSDPASSREPMQSEYFACRCPVERRLTRSGESSPCSFGARGWCSPKSNFGIHSS